MHIITFVLFVVIATASPVVLAPGYGQHDEDEDEDEDGDGDGDEELEPADETV